MTAADLYRALWGRKVLIATLTAVCLAATLFFSLRQTPVYEAETLVRIQQRIDEPSQAFESLEASQRLTETYAEIIQSGALGDRVERLLAPRLAGIVVSDRDLTAQPVKDLELLTIGARDPDPRRATVIANAVPAALRNFIRETGTLRDSIATVAPAELPASPASPNILLNLALALLLGLLVNGAIALLAELLADRLPDPDELEASIGVPVLTTVPTLEFTSTPRSFVRGARDDLPERGLDVMDPEGSRVG
ncbi:MAG: Wzz/FepE/Etk N-terminal domain-containing protein [Actinomycetota bacterium]|nr:Wzz/FepE/Etk N-terminal domain-containing protein [Actinomycetota bacterium]